MVIHSYHAKTGSNRFLQALLEQRFEVTLLQDESWQLGAPPLLAEAIDAHDPTCVLFFQQLPGRKQLRALRCSNLTWAPMHDGIDYGGSGWKKLVVSGLKVLNFCDFGQRHFSALGFDCLPLRYYPEASEFPPARFDDSALDIFFWTRRSALGWPVLKQLLGNQRPRRIVLRNAPDPGETPALPTAAEIAEYHIEVHSGWLAAPDYAQLLQSCNLLMAPRLMEGIGMTMLEAMARGMAVIAVDAPTMNEYLVHGQTGYLYAPDAPTPINLDQAEKVGARARQQVVAGREAWIKSVPEMLDFITRPCRRPASWRWNTRKLLRF